MSTTNSRKGFLDLLRVIACFLVIVNHTNSEIFLERTPSDPLWFVSISYFFACKIAVPSFFMITGYLMLGRQDDWKKTFQRMFRIGVVLVVCAVIYQAYACLTSAEVTPILAIKRVFKVYADNPSTALWYLYTYLGILLMMPFLQKMVALMTRKDYHVFFAASLGFFSVLPILRHYSDIFKVERHFELPLFSNAICLLLVGQYFARFGIRKTKKRFVGALALFLLMVGTNVVATYFEFQGNGKNYLFFDSGPYLPAMVSAICVFYMATFWEGSPKITKAISYLGGCTFGIYLISDLTISVLKPVYHALPEGTPVFLTMILFEVVVFLVGLGIVSVLKRIPGVRKFL